MWPSHCVTISKKEEVLFSCQCHHITSTLYVSMVCFFFGVIPPAALQQRKPDEMSWSGEKRMFVNLREFLRGRCNAFVCFQGHFCTNESSLLPNSSPVRQRGSYFEIIKGHLPIPVLAVHYFYKLRQQLGYFIDKEGVTSSLLSQSSKNK